MEATRSRQLGEVGIAIALGWCALVLPTLLDPPQRYYEPGFLPFMRDAVEGMKPYSLALLFAAGAALGFLGASSAWMLGFATILTFPVWSAADLAINGGHNLLPIEWLIYGIYGLVGCAGALAARRFARMRGAASEKHQAG